MHKLVLLLFCFALFATCVPAIAADASNRGPAEPLPNAGAPAPRDVKLPNIAMPDKSGELGKELNYLCLRQLGADCRDRLVFDKSSYLNEPFASAEPGTRMREHQIRPIASIVFASAALLRFGEYDESATGFTRSQMARITASLVRELAQHHVANTDKSSWWWGDEWQSAYWTANAGQGAWLIWNRLPASTRREVAAMIVFEANRFLKVPAPFNQFRDTKAEENAWNSEILALACCMMPAHPNSSLWDERAKEYMVSALATPEDVKSTRLVDGKPLNQWLRGPNVHSDYTLENHGFFHPDYTTSYYLNLQNLPVYVLAGKSAPESLFHNAEQLRDILMFLTLPNGWTYYPQYTDWSNYRHDVTIMSQSPNPVLPSAAGARCLRWGIDFIKYADSLNAGKTSQNLFRGLNFNCCPLDTMTHVYLLHYLLGPGAEPLSDQQARTALAGTRLFEQGKTVVCRSENAMASFSWFDTGRRLMACVTPMTKQGIAIPKFRSLIGTIGGKIDEAKTANQKTELLRGGGFSTIIDLKRGPDLTVEETVAMVALPDGRVVYAEWFGGVPDGVEVRTGLVFFENNPFWLHGVAPKVYYPGGVWEQSADPKALPSKTVALSGEHARWLNISDRFGIVLRGSKGVSIEDGQLVLNHRPETGGEASACVVAVFYPGASLKDTEGASRKIRVTGMGTAKITVDLGDRRVVLEATQGR